MMFLSRPLNQFKHRVRVEQAHFIYRTIWEKLHLEPVLLGLLLLLAATGLLILYSASQQNMTVLMHQSLRIVFGLCALFIVAQLSPQTYRDWSTYLFAIGLFLLIAVLSMGKIGKGAQRWLDLGILRFQPSELLKLAVPLLVARILSHTAPQPPWIWIQLGIVGFIIFIPGLLIAKQPDLGTAIITMGAGIGVVILSTMPIGLLILIGLSLASIVPLSLPFLHDYQKQRLMTFWNPEQDPLGSGYHIIQSKIALGSGGVLGKGWCQSSQAHLQFLPEHTTDFIFAVSGEEWGFLGSVWIIGLYLSIGIRIFVLACRVPVAFNRLVMGSLGLIFLTSAYVNMGMVCGLLPVVGVPLPFISYGGTSLLTQMVSFGIVMSMQSQRKLLG